MEATRVLSGKQLAGEIEAELADAVRAFAAGGRPPGLSVVRVGDDPASEVYVRSKVRSAERLGIVSEDRHLPADISQQALEEVVADMNRNPAISGILCQLPLPGHLDAGRITRLIDPIKDVDCFHPYNVGLLTLGQPRFLPCTPAGILALLERHGIDGTGAHAVIVGRSNIVGRPLSILMSHTSFNATVTVCHSRTRDLPALLRQADILVAATGKPEWITGEMVKPGAVVIDVGMNRVDDPGRPRGYRLCGDVHYASVAPKSSAITPVPGGVGPMTISMVLRNTLTAARLQRTEAQG